ncbi:pilus assembly protein TadG-related protein [Fundidesulfovibrio agrisoli]|uniref:pilus assembly protein TadG-related protein n=1 Tax=Fundidesulfovibrio agrisoli TaxID=2922717 RepID=UPI001FAE2FBD|nr:pilus assembly protein TadG-related protein [Fundidesulfovibrio agrisoli]
MKDSRKFPRQGGSVAVVVAISLVVLAGFGAFAVDLGYLKWKRGQMQAAADAGALAGAAALLSFGSNTTKIAAEAVAYGQANVLTTDKPGMAVRDQDVTVNTVGNGFVEVTAGLTGDRGNPVALFLGPVLGKNLADVSATARAALYCVTNSRCLKPWVVPTKFTWNDAADSVKQYKNNGLLDTKSAPEMASIQVQGYSASDVGTQIVLKYGDSKDTIAPGVYNPIDFPPVNKGNPIPGGAEYRTNISGCLGSSNTDVAVGDTLQMEPGNMTGPTKQGIEDLIKADPSAKWDTSTQSIVGVDSKYGPDPLNSPRVGMIAFYDPRESPSSGRDSVKVYQLGAVFIEGMDGKGDVTARFIKAMASSPAPDPAGTCGTLYGVGLIRDSSR